MEVGLMDLMVGWGLCDIMCELRLIAVRNR